MNPLQYFEDNIVGHYNAPRRAHIVLSAEYNIYKFKFRQTGRFQMLNDHSEYFNYPAVSFLLIPLGSVNAHYLSSLTLVIASFFMIRTIIYAFFCS